MVWQWKKVHSSTKQVIDMAGLCFLRWCQYVLHVVDHQLFLGENLLLRVLVQLHETFQQNQ